MIQILIYFLLISCTVGSHYRGGSISWSIQQSDYVNGSATVPVRITQRHAWRRSAALSFWNTPECDSSTIANRSALLGEGYLQCRSPDCYNSYTSPYQTISTQVACTDYSVDYDYATGENSTVVDIPIDKTFLYIFASCCWIDLLTVGGSDWVVSLVINTHRRIDGLFNSAPVSAMNPIVTVQLGQTHIIDIPMADADGDRLSCRWSANNSEAGGIFEAKGVLQSYPCQLTYHATTLGYEGIAVMIEDFDSDGRVLSSIPLQFLIHIVPEITTPTTPEPSFTHDATIDVNLSTPPPTCSTPPEYKGDWQPGACIGVASNGTVRIRVVVEIPCSSSSTGIHEILTISPSGMNRSDITQNPPGGNTYVMNLQWTPDPAQYGIHQLCVTPVDNNTQSGRTACFALLVDVQSPQFLQNSNSPSGIVPSTQSIWTIDTDVDIVPPRDNNVSAVFYKRDNSSVNGGIEILRVPASNAEYQPRQIIFFTNGTTWEDGQDYYILLDGGLATINQSCGIQSSPILDSEFWKFSIPVLSVTIETVSTTAIESFTSTLLPEPQNQTVEVTFTATTISDEPSTASTRTISDEPFTTTTTTISDEPSTTSTTTMSGEPSTTTTTTISDEPSTTSTTTIIGELSTTSTTTIIGEPSTTSTTTTTVEPSTTSTTTISDEPSTTTTTAISDEPSTTTTTAISDEPSTTSTTTISGEPSTTTTTTISDEPSTTSTTTISDEPSTTTSTITPHKRSPTTSESEQPSSTTTTAETSTTSRTTAGASSTLSSTFTLAPSTTTTSVGSNQTTDPLCPEWLPFGTIKNITTNGGQTNYTFCFHVNTSLADVTVAANTWTSCDSWKTSGAADPMMDLYDINQNPTLLAQNDDGNAIAKLNCYASVLSYRFTRGNYRVVIRHPKCNFGFYELRLSAETTNQLK